jgi:hypothetical protein
VFFGGVDHGEGFFFGVADLIAAVADGSFFVIVFVCGGGRAFVLGRGSFGKVLVQVVVVLLLLLISFAHAAKFDLSNNNEQSHTGPHFPVIAFKYQI